MAGSGRKVWAADEILAANDLQNYIQDQVVFVYNDATARTSGILSPTEGMVSYLKDTNLLYAFDGSNWVEIAPNVGTPGTYTKVTTDSKGRVSSGTTLSESDIPTLSISKTSGLQSALNGKQPVGNYQTALGFTPVQQGGGAGQGSSKVYIGWKGASLGCQVDATDVGDIALQGRGASFSNLYSTGVYNTSVTYGPYRSVWVNVDGTLGYSSSSRVTKQDIVSTDIAAESVLNIDVVDFKYKDAVKALGDDAPVETGVIAEQLVDAGLGRFVFFDNGKPSGVNYDRLVLAVIPQLKLQAERIDLLEARLAKLEK